MLAWLRRLNERIDEWLFGMWDVNLGNLDWEADIRAALAQLDGTELSSVMLLTGFTADEIEDLGGL